MKHLYYVHNRGHNSYNSRWLKKNIYRNFYFNGSKVWKGNLSVRWHLILVTLCPVYQSSHYTNNCELPSKINLRQFPVSILLQSSQLAHPTCYITKQMYNTASWHFADILSLASFSPLCTNFSHALSLLCTN